MNLNDLGWGGIPQCDTVRVGQSDPKTKIKLVWYSLSGATSYVIERGDSNATRISGFSSRAMVAGGSVESGFIRTFRIPLWSLRIPYYAIRL
jgi:hypothetical protein